MKNVIDFPYHQKLEAQARQQLEQRGFQISSLTYHERLSEDMAARLKDIYTPSALYLRSRADQIAVHTVHPLVFEYDLKTHTNPKYQDMTLELTPLVGHLAKRDIGGDCLYAYWNPYLKDLPVKGFWISNLPPAREIHIPKRWNGFLLEHFQRITRAFFPGIPVYRKGGGGGSGDPYLIVDKSAVHALPRWCDLIDALLRAYKESA